MSLTTIELFEA